MVLKAGIIGSGQSSWIEPGMTERWLELSLEAYEAALRDSGSFKGDIDAVYLARPYIPEGLEMAAAGLSESLSVGLDKRCRVSAIEGDGAAAFRQACDDLSAGRVAKCVVVAVSTVADAPDSWFDVKFEMPLKLKADEAGALQAMSYMGHFGLSWDRLAGVVSMSRERGAAGTRAYLHEQTDRKGYLETSCEIFPLRCFDIAPVAGSAVALVMAAESADQDIRKPAWVRGSGAAQERGAIGQRRLWEAPALRAAAKQAYTQARITDALKEISCFEISDYYSPQAGLWCEALGLAPSSKGLMLFERDNKTLPPGTVIDPSGGCLCGYALGVGGLARLAEASRWVQGRGAGQEAPCAKALAHSQSGLCGQSHWVFILGA